MNSEIINTCRVLSGEIGLGEKQDVHAHIFRSHPFYQQLSISRFAYFRLTLQQIPLHSQNNLFLPVSVFLQFVKRFPSILLSVELFLALKNELIGNSVSNLKFCFVFLFPEKKKLLALDGGLYEPTVGQPTCYTCKTD